MAANKFATMLHRKTNRMTFVLIYAALEWILIILLLLNSLFSYLIIKFSDFFGLKRPCLWCSRLDHITEPGKRKNSYRDLVCEAHASEISKLSYCRNHERLAESQDMCEDCSSSSETYFTKLSGNFSFYQWMKQIGIVQEVGDKAADNGDQCLVCSCCGLELDGRLFPPCNLLKSSWGDLDFTPKKNLTTEAGVSAEIDDEGDHWDQNRSDFVIDHHDDEHSTEENRGSHIVSEVDGGSCIKTEEAEGSCACSVCDGGKEMAADESDKSETVTEKGKEPTKQKDLKVHTNEEFSDQIISAANSSQNTSPEALPQHLEFYIDQDDCQLIPVEIIEFTNSKDQNQRRFALEEEGNDGNEDVILDFDMHFESENWHNSRDTSFFSGLESKEESNVIAVEDISEAKEEQASTENPEIQHVAEPSELPVSEDCHDHQENLSGREKHLNSEPHQAIQIQNDDVDPEVSIGSEIPEREQEGVDDQIQDIIPGSHNHMEEFPAKKTFISQIENENEGFLEFPTTPVKTSIQSTNNHFSSCMDLNENEEEKVPETPNSVESFHQLHKKLLLLERKESGTEESLDGSVVSDIDGGEVTVEKLKSVLKAERKALHALYTELEEERSASAVAANQTMAMINRLQEEKAAMQMEALQYQRMMEEQSEYDQEALQLLNELMVKKDKEKQELEKELDVYRKIVQDYEEKGRMTTSRRDCCARSRTSSVSCSNAEDSDGLSIDLNHEAKEENNVDSHQETGNQNTPEDAVLYIEESLARFEDERLSILDQLKALEGKLFILNEEEEEEEHSEDIKSVYHFHEENGNGYHENFDFKSEVNGYANGHAKENNGKNYQERKVTGAKAKRLLPLFDAVEEEVEDGVFNEDDNGIDDTASQSFGKVQVDKNRLALEEEVEYVYERLQALEADREFLKHCITSLNKGHKGLHLLQEILQHLRDLRNVELRFKSGGDGLL